MASQDNEQQKPLFNTPNPKELKEQAEKDPILNRYPNQDKDLDDMETDDNAASDSATLEEKESYFQDEENRALSSSPIINANISGG